MGNTIILLLLLAITVTALQSSTVHAWGSNVLQQPPSTSFASNFPSTPTVEVESGQSFEDALGECDDEVGETGYCRIILNGVPSDIGGDDGLVISRWRTMVTAKDGVVLSRSGNGAVVSVFSNTRYIVIQNLTIKGHSAAEMAGIQVSGGNIMFVIIRTCEIYDFDASDSAHGISVYGTSGSGVGHVSIDDNYVHDMKTGFSESIVVNGHVRRWSIINNLVEDVNNIAIDAIGGEGTYPPEEVGGRILPSSKDAARHGIIASNTVRRMSTETNSKYGSMHSWAAGIYVDGARDVVIQYNTVEDAEWGFEIGAENCVISENIELTGNTGMNNYFGDFVVGGYEEKGFLQFTNIGCNPTSSSDSEEGHGYVQRISVYDNVFNTTNGQDDTIVIQKRTTYAIIEQEGVEPVNDGGDGSASGDENAIRTSF